MSSPNRRRLNAIHAVTWAGCLGLVAVVGLSWLEHDLRAAAHTGGFVLACTFLGLVALCGRSLGFGVIATAIAMGCAGLWLGPLQNALHPFVVGVASNLGMTEHFASAYAALPAAAIAASMLLGVLLHFGTACGRIAFQSLMAGLVAAACLIAPGQPITLMAAAGLLWSLIILLSIASWARDRVLRLSDARAFVRLGQEGPLATLARGSTQQPG